MGKFDKTEISVVYFKLILLVGWIGTLFLSNWKWNAVISFIITQVFLGQIIKRLDKTETEKLLNELKQI